jgi:hypothetical protein
MWDLGSQIGACAKAIRIPYKVIVDSIVDKPVLVYCPEYYRSSFLAPHISLRVSVYK